MAKKRFTGCQAPRGQARCILPTGMVRRGFEPDRPCPGRETSLRALRAQMQDGLAGLTSSEL
jgi:hypothetical protein